MTACSVLQLNRAFQAHFGLMPDDITVEEAVRELCRSLGKDKALALCQAQSNEIIENRTERVN